MALIRTFFWLALAAALSVNAEGEIYRWVDDAGNVHFGDAPPEDRQTDEIKVSPAPSQDAVQAAKNRARRLQEFESTFRKDAKDLSKPEKPTRIERKPTRHSIDIGCFTAVGDAWGGRIADSREAVARRRLDQQALRQVRELLRPLTKRYWVGVQKDITCISPRATPPTKTEYFDVRLRARWKSDQLFGTEADLVGQRHGSRYRQFFWFLLAPEGMRFRRASTDISFDIDQPGNDVEVLTIDNTALTFFWRRRGRTRKTNVFSLRRSGTGYTLAQFDYTQGILSGKRYWTLGR